jgi:addiction module HigA family antidote
MKKTKYYVEDDFIPPYMSHPGVILKDELIARKITQQKFADMIKRPLKTISLIINGKKSITVETAYDLEKAFGVSAEFWLGMQNDYDLYLLKQKREQKEKRVGDRRIASIPVVGFANCGQATLFAEENVIDHVRYPIIKKDAKKTFALRAEGDSMNKANIGGKSIESGDIVIIKESNKAESGNYILSIIDGKANIKKFYNDKKNKQILLISESSEKIEPICITEKDKDDFLIQGIVFDVVKM